MKKFALIAFAAMGLLAGERQLGKPLTIKEPLSIDQVTAGAGQYVGKTVQVRGKITEVCQMAGCWMALADPQSGKIMRVKVNDGEIVFPKESIGRMARAEGTLEKLQLSKSQMSARLKHEAEEKGERFDPNKVKEGATLYQLRGTGAVLLD